MLAALRAFGAPLFGLTERDFEIPEVGLQMGEPPHRIDVLTKISGITFERAWPNRVELVLEQNLSCVFIGMQELLENKRSAGRPQDLADVAALEFVAKIH